MTGLMSGLALISSSIIKFSANMVDLSASGGEGG